MKTIHFRKLFRHLKSKFKQQMKQSMELQRKNLTALQIVLMISIPRNCPWLRNSGHQWDSTFSREIPHFATRKGSLKNQRWIEFNHFLKLRAEAEEIGRIQTETEKWIFFKISFPRHFLALLAARLLRVPWPRVNLLAEWNSSLSCEGKKCKLDVHCCTVFFW